MGIRNLALQLVISARDLASGAIDRIRGGVTGYDDQRDRLESVRFVPSRAGVIFLKATRHG